MGKPGVIVLTGMSAPIVRNLLAILLLSFGIAGCTSTPDRPDEIDKAALAGKALIVGSISKPATHAGFDHYSIDLVCPAERQAHRIRVSRSISPIRYGFPHDIVVENREKTFFARLVEPGRYLVARYAVDITNTFTTYTFGERGQLTELFDAEAGDIVYIGEHEFIPRHEDEIFLWRDLEAPDYRIRDSFDNDREQLEKLYPDIDWTRMRNPGLEKRSEDTRPIEESSVWINPFG